MFTYEKQDAQRYFIVKPFIKCQCGKANWVERYQPATELTTVYCGTCQHAMTFDQYNQGCIDYKFK